MEDDELEKTAAWQGLKRWAERPATAKEIVTHLKWRNSGGRMGIPGPGTGKLGVPHLPSEK
jgi:hypothetical protein